MYLDQRIRLPISPPSTLTGPSPTSHPYFTPPPGAGWVCGGQVNSAGRVGEDGAPHSPVASDIPLLPAKSLMLIAAKSGVYPTVCTRPLGLSTAPWVRGRGVTETGRTALSGPALRGHDVLWSTPYFFLDTTNVLRGNQEDKL